MTSAISSAQPENKLLGLEILRFITAFAILVWHYQHFSFIGPASAGFIREQQPFYTFFSAFYDYGLNAVQIFWCISGFIFFYKYREILANRSVDGRTFFILRFSRLYPLHFVTLLCVAGLQLLYVARHGAGFVYENNDLRHFALQIFMASYWGLQKGLSFNGPIWSISMEVLVYFVFYACLRLFGRANWVNFAIIGLFILAKTLGNKSTLIDGVGIFYAGGLASMLRVRFSGHRVWPWVQAGVLACLTLGILAAHVLKVLSDSEMTTSALFVLTPLLLVLASGRLTTPQSVARVIEGFGNLTYASYLLHFPLQLAAVLGFTALGLAVPFYSNGLFLAYLAVVLGLSYFVFRYFEKPAQDRIRRALLG